MNHVQWIARNALLPLLFAALASPALQAASLSTSLGLTGSEFAQRPAYATTPARPATGAAADNFTLITQAGDRLMVKAIRAAARWRPSSSSAAMHTKRPSRSTAA